MPNIDPEPWISQISKIRMPYHPGFGAKWIVFDPRPEYSQNREDYQ